MILFDVRRLHSSDFLRPISYGDLISPRVAYIAAAASVTTRQNSPRATIPWRRRPSTPPQTQTPPPQTPTPPPLLPPTSLAPSRSELCVFARLARLRLPPALAQCSPAIGLSTRRVDPRGTTRRDRSVNPL